MTKRKRRRTKKDKIIANLRRQVTTNLITSLTRQKIDNKVIEIPKPAKIKEQKDSVGLLAYHPQLIAKDLKRTAAMSIMVLLLELGLWIYLR